MIYFLKTVNAEFVKIGYTKFKDMERVAQISSSCPFKCELVLFIEGDLIEEKQLHKKFKESLADGKNEWFQYSNEIINFINKNKHLSQEPTTNIRTSTNKKKSDPVGIRFDVEKLDLVKGRDKLDTNQKVVDFLLNKYWWEHKVAKPSHKGLPPEEPTQSENKTIPAAIPESTLVMPPKPQSEFIASVNEFEARLRAIKSGGEGEKIMMEVKSALMPHGQKQYLERVAKEVSDNFFND